MVSKKRKHKELKSKTLALISTKKVQKAHCDLQSDVEEDADVAEENDEKRVSEAASERVAQLRKEAATENVRKIDSDELGKIMDNLWDEDSDD